MNNFILTEQGVTTLDVSNLEFEIGIILPEKYKEHILKFNGGCPNEKDCFKGKVIAHFYPIKYGKSPLEKTYDRIKDLLPNKFLNFAYDGGGNPFCFNLNDGINYGKIYYCPMDMGEVEPEFLANSFEEFMNGLTEDCDY